MDCNTEEIPKPISELEKTVIEDFALFDDWADKYQYVIELGQKLLPLDNKYKTEEYKIKGCQSTLWIHAVRKNNRIYFYADSDSTFVKGLAAVLINVLSGQPAKEIVDSHLEFIDKIGLTSHLAASRSNGLSSMIRQLKLYALAGSEGLTT